MKLQRSYVTQMEKNFIFKEKKSFPILQEVLCPKHCTDYLFLWFVQNNDVVKCHKSLKLRISLNKNDLNEIKTE